MSGDAHAVALRPRPARARRRASLASGLRAHAAIAAVVAGAAVIRVAAAAAYAPALFYTDSWGYASSAFGNALVGVAPLRPSGYPLALRALSVFGRDLATITTVQHLGGLVGGVLVYVLLLRLGVGRALACAAAALILLDGYAIALEQYLLAEPLFTLLLVGCVFLSLDARGCTPRLAGAGLLLAAAAITRPVALFVIPVWIAYVAWTRMPRRAAAAGCAALLVPLLGYCALHAAATGSFGLTQGTGWFLYGRVGSIVRCAPADVPHSERALCTDPARHGAAGPSYFMFDRRSPAHRAFGGISANSHRQAASDTALRNFALMIIAHRPGAYVKLAGGDFLRYFTPGAASRYGDDHTLHFPPPAQLSWGMPRSRGHVFASYRPQARPPAAQVRAYSAVVHTPRWLMALCVLASLVTFALALSRRARVPRQRAPQLLLLTGGALAMLLGSAATAGFALRYLLPAVPLLAAAGAISAHELVGAARARGAASSASAQRR